MRLLILFSIYLLGVTYAAPSKVYLPKFVKTCYRDASDFSDCLLQSIQDIVPNLARGIREMDLPPLDPLYLAESIYEFRSGDILGHMVLKDCYTYGLENSKFKSVKANFDDPKKIELDVDFFLPLARTEGKYKSHGQFGIIQFNGRGLFNITSENINVHWKITGEISEKNGEKYLRINQFLVTPRTKTMKIEASDLVPENPALSKNLLGLINQHWELAYEGMLPYSQEVWDKLFRNIANRLFTKVPFDKIFPTSQ